MAIVKTIGEIKTLLPRLLAGLNNQALLPNMDHAAQKHLVPVIGATLFNQVHDKYVAGTALSADEQALLPKMQLLVAANAFHDELAFSHATITDNGVRTAQTQNMPRVYGWEFKALKNALQETAMDALDSLLQYLVTNAAKFPAWQASEQAKQLGGLLIKTATEFDGIHSLFQPFRTFYALKTIMQDVQEQCIIGSIGVELFNHFNTATNLTGDEKVIKRQLQKALAFLTIKRTIEHHAVRMDQNGFTIVSGDPESETAGRTATGTNPLLALKMEVCDRDGNNFLAMARFGIYKNRTASDVTTEFTTAFDASPLVNYVPPSQRESGNHRRKIFRF